MSGFGSQNLNKVSDYTMTRLRTEPESQWQFFWRGNFRKLFGPSAFEFILNFRGMSCLVLALEILIKYQTTMTS
jgi:hypothetical protein